MGIVSTRPNEPPKPSSAAPHRRRRDAQLERRGHRRDGVVDVVEAGEGEAQVERPLWRAQGDL